MINIQKSYSVYFVLFGPLWFYLVHFGPVSPHWSYFVHFSLIRSTLVLFGPFCSLRSIQSKLVLFGRLWSYLVHYVHFDPNLSICSLFSPLWLFSVQISPLYSIWSTSVLYGPLQSYSVHLVPIRSYSIHSVHFISFGPIRFICALTYREKTCLLYFSLNTNLLKIYINLKLIISKILSIAFIVATFLLSHINVAFQSTSV